MFAEILKTDGRGIAGSLRPSQIKLYSFADRSYRSEQSRFRAVRGPFDFFPPSVPRIDASPRDLVKSGAVKKKKHEGVRVELAGSLLVNHAMTNYRRIDAGKRAEDRSIEAVPSWPYASVENQKLLGPFPALANSLSEACTEALLLPSVPFSLSLSLHSPFHPPHLSATNYNRNHGAH